MLSTNIEMTDSAEWMQNSSGTSYTMVSKVTGEKVAVSNLKSSRF